MAYPSQNPWFADPLNILGQTPAAQMPGAPAPAQPGAPGYPVIKQPGSQPIVMIPIDKNKKSSQITTTENKAVPLSPAEASTLGDSRDLLVRDYLKSYRDQEAGVDEQLGRLSDVEKAAQPQLNLSPLMALADAWGAHKSNLAGSYTAPMTPVERAMMLEKLDNGIQSQRSKLTTSDLAILRTLLPAGNVLANKSVVNDESQGGVQPVVPKATPLPRNPPSAMLPKGSQFLAAFNKDAQPYVTSRDAATQVLNAFASGSKVAPVAAQTLISRASGEKGKIPYALEVRYQGDPSALATLKRAYTRASSGVLEPGDRAEIEMLAKAYSGEADDRLGELYNDYTTNRFGAYNLDQPSAQKYLSRFAPHPRVAAPAPRDRTDDLLDQLKAIAAPKKGK